VELAALKSLLLRVSIEDERVETGEKVEAVGDPFRYLDHAGQRRAIEENPQLLYLILGQIEDIEQHVLQCCRPRFERGLDQIESKLA